MWFWLGLVPYLRSKKQASPKTTFGWSWSVLTSERPHCDTGPPLLRCWAMQSLKPMPWKILRNFSHLYLLDLSFSLFSSGCMLAPSSQEVARCHPEWPWNWQPVSCTRGLCWFSGLASSTQNLGTTTIFGLPSEKLGTTASFGGSSESGLQEWWWAERPISQWLLQSVMWLRFWGTSVFGSRLLQVWVWPS